MERTLADDLKAALFVLLGSTLGYLVFGGGISVLLACVVGAVFSIVVMNVLRFVKRRRGT